MPDYFLFLPKVQNLYHTVYYAVTLVTIRFLDANVVTILLSHLRMSIDRWCPVPNTLQLNAACTLIEALALHPGVAPVSGNAIVKFHFHLL